MAPGGSLLSGIGDEGVENGCVSSLKEAMKGLRGRYVLADLFGLPLGCVPLGTKVPADQGCLMSSSFPGQGNNKMA